MYNLRTHGTPPFGVAVVHGGPGAPGEMAPVARELASEMGVLEPLQTARTLDGQIEELRSVLEKNAALPVALVGFSWGSWLSLLLAARYPRLVRKLILVSSGGYEDRDSEMTRETRLGRLSASEKKEVESLTSILDDPEARDRNAALSRLGTLLTKTDAYDPVPVVEEPISCDAEAYRAVWKEAADMRNSGSLLKMARHVSCPVIAIHGSYDPHPAKGVQVPLSKALRDFRFVLLDKCGHKPWAERLARDKFYDVLRKELGQGP